MTDTRHLTEAERHDAADGSLAAEQRAAVDEHLEHCEACATDVARVRQLMTRIHATPAPADSGADLWPEIRLRIEREKIVQLPATEPLSPRSRLLRHALLAVAGVAAALLLVVVLPLGRGKGKARQAESTLSPEVRLVADSAREYAREATILLNELELRRAMIPPQRRTAIDHDLAVIDSAIVELQQAIARDPNNAALRRLLASSYRQKIDVLKRAGGPG